MSLLVQVMESVSDLTKQLPSYASLKLKVIDHLECKCLPVTPIVTLCCNQLLGCRVCFDASTNDELICPLCRSKEVAVVPLKGFDDLFAELATTD